MSGISNIDIENFFIKEKNEDLKRNFKKVISSDSLTKYIDFKKIIAKDKSHYPFLIMNTSRKNHRGVHWWRILNTDLKKELFLFDSKGFEGFKVFILSDDKYIIDKALYNVKQFEKKDKKVSAVTIEFSIPNYRSLKQLEINSLSTTAQNLLHLLVRICLF